MASKQVRRGGTVYNLSQKQASSTGFGWTSSNWSGYAITRGKGGFTSITANWVVPKVSPSKKSTYSSAWIGIDGYNNSSLIQTGTEHDFEKGKALYYAWWEILPAAETRIKLRVRPGDFISASIRKLSGKKWSIRLTNHTRNWTFRTVRTYTGPQTSAEWIMEAPEINGEISTLARYSRTKFANCSINGKNPNLQISNGGVMTQNNKTVSTPSVPSRSRNSFSVAYGSRRPVLANSRPLLLIKFRGRTRVALV